MKKVFQKQTKKSKNSVYISETIESVVGWVEGQ